MMNFKIDFSFQNIVQVLNILLLIGAFVFFSIQRAKDKQRNKQEVAALYQEYHLKTLEAFAESQARINLRLQKIIQIDSLILKEDSIQNKELKLLKDIDKQIKNLNYEIDLPFTFADSSSNSVKLFLSNRINRRNN